MFTLLYRKSSVLFRSVMVFTITSFLATTAAMYAPAVYAESVPYLPAPNSLMRASTTFTPVTLKGIKFYPDDPFKLDFVLNEGTESLTSSQLQEETKRLVKYFLTALTIPAKDLWVNLSPYEQDRIIPDALGATDVGRDLLGQDYILKQLSSSLTYPESDLGKQYWQSVFEKAQKLYGTTKIPVNTYNKVWIVPGETQVFESGTNAVITKNELDVMTEEDFTALQNNQPISIKKADTSNLSARVLKDLIIPEIRKDVNEGKNFAYLRQIHSAIVLAGWFKLRLKESIYSKLYIDKGRVRGIENEDPAIKEKVFNQYVEAFKAGAYNYVKQDVDAAHRTMVKRTYFSGGARLGSAQTTVAEGGKLAVVPTTQDELANGVGQGTVVPVNLAQATAGTPDIVTAANPTAELEDAVLAKLAQSGATKKPGGTPGRGGAIVGILLAAAGLGAATTTTTPAKAEPNRPTAAQEAKARDAVGSIEVMNVAMPGVTGKVATVALPASLPAVNDPLFTQLAGGIEGLNPGSPKAEQIRQDVRKAVEVTHRARFSAEASYTASLDKAYSEGGYSAAAIYKTAAQRDALAKAFVARVQAIAKTLSQAAVPDAVNIAQNIAMMQMGVDGRLGWLITSGKAVIPLAEVNPEYIAKRTELIYQLRGQVAQTQVIVTEMNNWATGSAEVLDLGKQGGKVKLTPAVKETLGQLAAYLGSPEFTVAGAKAIAAKLPGGLKTVANSNIAFIENTRAFGRMVVINYGSDNPSVAAILGVMPGGKTADGKVVKGMPNIMVVGTNAQMVETQDGVKKAADFASGRTTPGQQPSAPVAPKKTTPRDSKTMASIFSGKAGKLALMTAMLGSVACSQLGANEENMDTIDTRSTYTAPLVNQFVSTTAERELAAVNYNYSGTASQVKQQLDAAANDGVSDKGVVDGIRKEVEKKERELKSGAWIMISMSTREVGSKNGFIMRMTSQESAGTSNNSEYMRRMAVPVEAKVATQPMRATVEGGVVTFGTSRPTSSYYRSHVEGTVAEVKAKLSGAFVGSGSEKFRAAAEGQLVGLSDSDQVSFDIAGYIDSPTVSNVRKFAPAAPTATDEEASGVFTPGADKLPGGGFQMQLIHLEVLPSMPAGDTLITYTKERVLDSSAPVIALAGIPSQLAQQIDANGQLTREDKIEANRWVTAAASQFPGAPLTVEVSKDSSISESGNTIEGLGGYVAPVTVGEPEHSAQVDLFLQGNGVDVTKLTSAQADQLHSAMYAAHLVGKGYTRNADGTLTTLNTPYQNATKLLRATRALTDIGVSRSAALDLAKAMADKGILGEERKPGDIIEAASAEESDFTKGGISAEKMRIVVKSDGTAVPMFKDVEIDPANFKGFTFNISSLQRNKTGQQIFLASAY